MKKRIKVTVTNAWTRGAFSSSLYLVPSVGFYRSHNYFGLLFGFAVWQINVLCSRRGGLS